MFIRRSGGGCCDDCSCGCAGSGCCPDCAALGVQSFTPHVMVRSFGGLADTDTGINWPVIGAFGVAMLGAIGMFAWALTRGR